MNDTPITIEQQIACVRRELALRKNVYPGFVARGKMTQAGADYQIAAMQSVHDTLTAIQAGETDATAQALALCQCGHRRGLHIEAEPVCMDERCPCIMFRDTGKQRVP